MSRRRDQVRRRALAPVALLAVLALVPGCASPSAPPQASAMPPASAVGADASRSPAAELQAGTAHLLVERVHLTASARAAVRPDERADALRALDEVAVALADLLGATAPAGRDPLLAALRLDDLRTVQHADALRSGGPAAVALSRADLDVAHDGLTSALSRVVPRMSRARIGERLGDDLTAQLAVGDDDPYAALAVAAGRAGGTARMIAGGIVRDRRIGPPGARAATLRADLTAALTGHVLLAGAVARESARESARPGGARDGGARGSAVEALEDDGDRLADLLGGPYPVLREPFRTSWADHVERVVALAASPGARERQAVTAYAPEVALLVAEQVDGLPATTAALELEPLLAALADAVVAGAGAAPDAHAALRRATAAVPAAAALLAAAIAEDRRYA